jgi:hypothetical protein
MLQEHPFSSRIATGMTGMFLGDLLAQVFPPLMARLRPPAEPHATPAWRYDAPRAARLVLFSAVLGTPVAYYWYTFLDAVSCLLAVSSQSSLMHVASWHVP